ncbi:predicted protein [Naegleria gruberi]|uniref:Predicted protein n=1 Tax=Naegleria gruberi TaxID=5762 RepID=D2VSH0_NAEGR|nr:uncharacterized protein NAEGRDRAFT_51902 [Naegleria gruberi]EFC40119.1 predicted protein [Naegleria gruberi]|eukprot:XP_002672863.1 predicted protein [Naegleria gruberi strain NEG-M]
MRKLIETHRIASEKQELEAKENKKRAAKKEKKKESVLNATIILQNVKSQDKEEGLNETTSTSPRSPIENISPDITNDAQYNAIVNAKDLRESIKILTFTMIEMKTDVQRDMKSMKKDIAEIKVEITEIKKDMYSLNRNVGCLYEGQVKAEFEKNFQVESPKILEYDKFSTRFAEVYSQNGYLNELVKKLIIGNVLSKEEKRKLTLKTFKVELNFVLTDNSNSTKVQIIEATMSSFSNPNKLICKLVQLERQVLFYKACYPSHTVTKIGLVSPSDLDSDMVKDALDKYPGLVVVKSFLDEGNFETIRLGNKPEIF